MSARWLRPLALKGARAGSAVTATATLCCGHRKKEEMAEGATEDMETNATSNGSEEMETNAKAAKQKRYDRQLRLWGEHGQEAMEECSVCLLNASACGSETLKNLVLPGARAPLERGLGEFDVEDRVREDADNGGTLIMATGCQNGS